MVLLCGVITVKNHHLRPSPKIYIFICWPQQKGEDFFNNLNLLVFFQFYYICPDITKNITIKIIDSVIFVVVELLNFHAIRDFSDRIKDKRLSFKVLRLQSPEIGEYEFLQDSRKDESSIGFLYQISRRSREHLYTNGLSVM